MTRILLFVVLGLFVLVALRRALAAGRVDAPPRRKPRRGSGAPGPPGPPTSRRSQSPDQLVCGACGQEFDPEASGWICPSCGK